MPDDNDGYLTMARIMGKELAKWQVENVWGKRYSGTVELAVKNAFEAGFMAGFEGRYFNESD